MLLAGCVSTRWLLSPGALAVLRIRPENGLFGLLSMVDLITFWMLIVRRSDWPNWRGHP